MTHCEMTQFKTTVSHLRTKVKVLKFVRLKLESMFTVQIHFYFICILDTYLDVDVMADN